MKNLVQQALALVLLSSLTACTNPRAYLDPGLPKVSSEELRAVDDDFTVGVTVECQTDGVPNAAATASAREMILSMLEDSGVFSTVSRGLLDVGAQLDLVINNTDGDIEGSPYLTGWSGGLVGTKAIDRYIISASYSKGNGQTVTMGFERALYAVFGGGNFPEDAQVLSVGDAYYTMLEQVVFLFLRDLQESGGL